MIKRYIAVNGDRKSERCCVIPDTCPICKSNISPVILFAKTKSLIFENDSQDFIVIMACPACQDVFSVTYELTGGDFTTYKSLSPEKPIKKYFDKKLSDFSPMFIETYNQALAAEAYHLNQIAGMGYRKALEFLIKDYAISLEPDKKEDIKRKWLVECIEKYIDDPDIQVTAKASALLGNDEAHYIRKYEDKDINDLKRFLQACEYWIVYKLCTKEALELLDKK